MRQACQRLSSGAGIAVFLYAGSGSRCRLTIFCSLRSHQALADLPWVAEMRRLDGSWPTRFRGRKDRQNAEPRRLPRRGA